jgi:hypothetical protein
MTNDNLENTVIFTTTFIVSNNGWKLLPELRKMSPKRIGDVFKVSSMRALPIV